MSAATLSEIRSLACMAAMLSSELVSRLKTSGVGLLSRPHGANDGDVVLHAISDQCYVNRAVAASSRQLFYECPRTAGKYVAHNDYRLLRLVHHLNGSGKGCPERNAQPGRGCANDLNLVISVDTCRPGLSQSCKRDSDIPAGHM